MNHSVCCQALGHYVMSSILPILVTSVGVALLRNKYRAVETLIFD